MTEDLLNPDKGEPTDYLQALIGEGGKFHDPDEKVALQKMAKGKWEADRTLKFREERMDEMRRDLLAAQEEVKAKAKFEDMLNELRESKSSTSSNTNQHAKDVVVDRPQFDPNELDNLLNKKLEERDVKKRHDENYNIVERELRERYGNSYPEVLQKTIKELDLDSKDINDLARKSPKAFFKAIGMDQQERDSFQAPPKSNQRAQSFAPKANRRDWTYYQDLSKSNPTTYWDPKTQTQMLKDAIEQGDAFKTGDYGKFGDT